MSAEANKFVINILREAMNFLEHRPYLFLSINAFVAGRLKEAARITDDGQLLLLMFSFRNFTMPFEAYYNYLFREKLIKSDLEERIMKDGNLNRGEAGEVISQLGEMDIDEVIKVEGGIDYGAIKETLSEIRETDKEHMKKILSDIVSVMDEILSEISKEGSEELLRVYQELIQIAEKEKDVKALREKLDEYLLEFDRRVKTRFVVS